MQIPTTTTSTGHRWCVLIPNLNIISSFAAFMPAACRLLGQNHDNNHIQIILIANAFEFEYVSNSGMVECLGLYVKIIQSVHGASILNVSTNASIRVRISGPVPDPNIELCGPREP